MVKTTKSKTKKPPQFTQWGDPVLSKPTKKVSATELKSPKFRSTLRRMFKWADITGAFGIAANQVGIPKRFAILVIKPKPELPLLPPLEPTVIINPNIVGRSKAKQYGVMVSKTHRYWEGCLSNPPGSIRYMTERSLWVDVVYTDINGRRVKQRVNGFHAILFQHEIDHLDGKVCAESIVVRNGKVLPGAIITHEWYAKTKGALPKDLKK
ncbi:MAG: peptide deformylase [Candidatus Colwellbacteria bacterium]|nr:peptide deformylase [Candidatus Colwellbacteria bacterium]